MGIRMRSREETQVRGKDTEIKLKSNSFINIEGESSSCDFVVIDSPPSYGTSSNRYEKGKAMKDVSLCGVIIIDDDDDLNAPDEYHSTHRQVETQCNMGQTSEPKAEGEFSDYFGLKSFSKLSRCSKSNKSPKNESGEDSDSSDCIIIEDPTDELREFCYKSLSRKKSLHHAHNPRNQTTSPTFLIDSDSESESDLSSGSSKSRRSNDSPNDFEEDAIHGTGNPRIHSLIPSSHPPEEQHPSCSEDIKLPTKIELVENFINPREQLKETEDYKALIEQEWLSRQREVRIQAEEAQKMRKRKKALMEMEKRQKERLQEIRDTQKKDEEDLTMKDHLRAKLIKDVQMLESTSFDMASLLSGLGIPIPLHPSPNEVHSAYRQALLKFHPDRVAKKDILLQVEAEEKFKLLLRMKDKFSCT